MTLPPESENFNQKGRYSSLEFQLDQIPAVSDRIVRKHWGHAEKEQYPFWIGILLFAVLLFLWLSAKDLAWVARNQWFGFWVGVLMLVVLVPFVAYHIRKLQGRFERQWSMMSADGELFRLLREAALTLGYPVEFGKPDEIFSTLLNIPFPDAVRAIEIYLKSTALPDPVPPDSPPGLYVSALTLKQPSSGETHRVYEAEYRGTIVRAFSVRIDAVDAASRVTIGFMLRPSKAETREVMTNSVMGRLHDRLIASKVLGDIRETAGVETEPIPVVESEQTMGGPAPSQAL